MVIKGEAMLTSMEKNDQGPGYLYAKCFFQKDVWNPSLEGPKFCTHIHNILKLVFIPLCHCP